MIARDQCAFWARPRPQSVKEVFRRYTPALYAKEAHLARGPLSKRFKRLKPERFPAIRSADVFHTGESRQAKISATHTKVKFRVGGSSPSGTAVTGARRAGSLPAKNGTKSK